LLHLVGDLFELQWNCFKTLGLTEIRNNGTKL